MAETFGRERRVRRHADYVRIQSKSERVSTRHFYFLVAPSGLALKVRLGLIVTRKLGGAVVRNRIKRICRECFRRGGNERPWAPDGIDLVVVARTGAEKLGALDALAEWEQVRPLIHKRASQALAKASNKGHLSAADRRGSP